MWARRQCTVESAKVLAGLAIRRSHGGYSDDERNPEE